MFYYIIGAKKSFKIKQHFLTKYCFVGEISVDLETYKDEFCTVEILRKKSHGLRRSSFSLCRMRAPHALRLLYIRSPLAYAYAEFNAHGARYARSLSFARKGVLRTSQDRQIEQSLSLDFFASLNAKEPRFTP